MVSELLLMENILLEKGPKCAVDCATIQRLANVAAVTASLATVAATAVPV